MNWSYAECNTLILKGIHKRSTKEVDIKITSKQGMTLYEMNDLRSQVHVLNLAQCNGVIKVFDQFENERFHYTCFERFTCLKKKLIKRIIDNESFISLPPPLSLQEYILSQVQNEQQEIAHRMREKRIMHISQQLLKTLNKLHQKGLIMRKLDLSSVFLT